MTRRPKLLRRIFTLSLLVTTIAPVHAAATRNFLWKATDRSGAAVYLVGSVHLLSKDFYPLSAALERAFTESDLLVEEADMGEMGAGAQMQFLSRGMLPSTTSLDKVLSPATYALLTTRAATIGIPIEPLKLLKPWMVAQMLEVMEWQKAGFDPDLASTSISTTRRRQPANRYRDSRRSISKSRSSTA